MMLLETLEFHYRRTRLASFEYRAINPLVVNQAITIHGAVAENGELVRLWAENDEGVVGMTGIVRLRKLGTRRKPSSTGYNPGHVILSSGDPGPA